MKFELNKLIDHDTVVKTLKSGSFKVSHISGMSVEDARPVYILGGDEASVASRYHLPVETMEDDASMGDLIYTKSNDVVLVAYMATSNVGDEILFPSIDGRSVVLEKKTDDGWEVTLSRKLK